MLIVSSVPPLPEGGAAARCIVGLLRGLESLGVDAQLLCPGPLRAEELEILAPFPVEVVAVPPMTVAARRRERVLAPMTRLGHGPFAEAVAERSSEADVTHFVELAAAAALAQASGPALVQLHCLARRDDRVWNPLRQAGRASIELLRAERRVLGQARWLLANSQEMGRDLANCAAAAEVAVGPLALDPESYRPAATLQEPTAGLIGQARWPPTAGAVRRLLLEVWPRVLARRPDARLALAGEGMQRSAFPELPDLPGVEWRGRVPSASAFLRELGLLLYPLTAGSGAKVKVLEALALGLPVVTTPEGAEGIGGNDGLVVDTDDEHLAQAAAELIGDLERRVATGRAALETFAAHHAPGPAARPVVDLYERMAG